MAKKKEAGEEIKNNIDGLDALAKEFKTGKMVEKKRIALKAKLVSLFLEKKITEEEQELMEAILKKERSHAVISSRDGYLLASIENERADGKCIVKDEDAPVVHFLKKDLECNYDFDADFNDNKGKPDSIGRYIVYVPRVVPTEHQLSPRTVIKEMKGHPTDPSEYPEPKILIHRIVLKVKEFHKWFDVVDEEILAPEKKEAEYIF